VRDLKVEIRQRALFAYRLQLRPLIGLMFSPRSNKTVLRMVIVRTVSAIKN
jgi:hypothetical protein